MRVGDDGVESWRGPNLPECGYGKGERGRTCHLGLFWTIPPSSTIASTSRKGHSRVATKLVARSFLVVMVHFDLLSPPQHCPSALEQTHLEESAASPTEISSAPCRRSSSAASKHCDACMSRSAPPERPCFSVSQSCPTLHHRHASQFTVAITSTQPNHPTSITGPHGACCSGPFSKRWRGTGQWNSDPTTPERWTQRPRPGNKCLWSWPTDFRYQISLMDCRFSPLQRRGRHFT